METAPWLSLGIDLNLKDEKRMRMIEGRRYMTYRTEKDHSYYGTELR
jgi:hypothetical protein